MIRINWDEVEATKNRLIRSGATESLDLIVVILYHNKPDCEKLQVKLGQLESALFDLSANEKIKGVFLYDLAMKRPYMKCEEPDKVSVLESVPGSGHANVLLEFNKMSPEARDVWIEIALSQQQHHVREGV